MQHSDEVRARMIVYEKSIHAIYTERIAEARRKIRQKGSATTRPQKASYEGAVKEYLRRVSVQQIYR